MLEGSLQRVPVAEGNQATAVKRWFTPMLSHQCFIYLQVISGVKSWDLQTRLRGRL